MKKRISVIIAAIVALVMSFSLIACGPNGSNESGVYKITFDANGGMYDSVDTVVVKTKDGKLSELPLDPTTDKVGVTFDGYNLAADGSGDKVTLDTVYTKNTTVYAQWRGGAVSGAFNKLAATDGYKINIDGSLKTKANATGAAIELDAEKRGNSIKLDAVGNTCIYDLDTGYMYVKGEDGKYFWEQQFPAGMPDYIASQMGGAVDTSIIDQLAVYDETADAYVIHIDLAEQFNALTAPLYAAYNGTGENGSLYALLNGYIKLYDAALSVDSLLETATAFIDGVKDMTIDDVCAAIDELKLLDAPVKEMLEQAGFTKEMYDSIKDRKVGEMLTAALDCVEEYLQALGQYDPSDPDAVEPVLDPNMLLYAVLFEEVSPSSVAQLKTRLDVYAATLIQMLKQMSVKDMIDMYIVGQPALGIMLSESVQFTELKADIYIKISESGELASVTGSVKLAHDYEPGADVDTDSADLAFLVDNDYHMEFAVTFSDYAATTTPFAIDYADWQMYEQIISVMLPATGDVTVYFESGNAELEVKPIASDLGTPRFPYGAIGYIDYFGDFVACDFGASEIIAEYDAETKCFTIDRTYIDSILVDDEYSPDFTLCYVVALSDGSQPAGTVDFPYLYIEILQASM